MTQSTASLQIRSDTIQENPPISLLKLEGRFDAEGLPVVLAEIEKSRSTGSIRFMVDLEEVTFIGSAGIGIFLSLVEELNSEGGGVVFLSVPEAIQRIFDVLNVLEFLQIRNDQESAREILLSGNA